MKLDREGVTILLNAVSDQLVLLRSPIIELVVCGGSALQALGLIDRTTRDLDILVKDFLRKVGFENVVKRFK